MGREERGALCIPLFFLSSLSLFSYGDMEKGEKKRKIWAPLLFPFVLQFVPPLPPFPPRNEVAKAKRGEEKRKGKRRRSGNRQFSLARKKRGGTEWARDDDGETLSPLYRLPAFFSGRGVGRPPPNRKKGHLVFYSWKRGYMGTAAGRVEALCARLPPGRTRATNKPRFVKHSVRDEEEDEENGRAVSGGLERGQSGLPRLAALVDLLGSCCPR